MKVLLRNGIRIMPAVVILLLVYIWTHSPQAPTTPSTESTAANWLRALRSPQIEIVRQLKVFYMPYWLGFYGRQDNLRCRVLDAVRRRIEGSRASALFEQWLAA